MASNHEATDPNCESYKREVNRNRKNILYDEIEELIIELRPKIVCLTETHVTEEIDISELKILNFEVIRCDSENRRNGGILTYIDENLEYKIITIKNIEQRTWISTIQLMGSYKDITICNVYHSPSKSTGAFITDIRLKQYVKGYTRITETSATLIDLAFSNFKIDAHILSTPKITDHSIIKIDLHENEKNGAKITEFYRRDYTNFKEHDFNNRIINNIEQTCNVNSSVDDTASNIVIGITESMNIFAPIIKKRLPKRWQSKPWITNAVREASRQRDQAYKRATSSKSIDDWTQYRTMRNKVVLITRQCKRQFYEENIDSVKADPKRMWKTLKTDIANKFNDFFLNSIDDILNHGQDDGGYDIDTDINIMTGLKNKNGTEEGISTEILKIAWRSIGSKMLMLVNKSMQEGVFPETWKTSTVVPIPKVTGSKKAEEHRPINMLPMNNILRDEQSGFREGFSCETALQNVIIGWKKSTDKNEKVGVVFLDFKRAFETVDRQRLLIKMEKYGIKGMVLKWFHSYLTHNNIMSKKRVTKHGVPQGSVLGPILFVLYINDIVNQLEYCKCKMFADDTVIYVSGNDECEIERKLNDDLKNISRWLYKNGLRLNTNKTKFMIIHDYRKPHRINNCDIKENVKEKMFILRGGRIESDERNYRLDILKIHKLREYQKPRNITAKSSCEHYAGSPRIVMRDSNKGFRDKNDYLIRKERQDKVFATPTREIDDEFESVEPAVKRDLNGGYTASEGSHTRLRRERQRRALPRGKPRRTRFPLLASEP
ncbi:uncharacterized protein LOC124413536 [Diprion similis]|uniref:uncharacterized protein LOC124413536 n=1 Tax=Diprion similis TaxID=362088 RepID=UPI001EF95571|nr:uncharacterized protein LOC124413536 [Diprion similis]